MSPSFNGAGTRPTSRSLPASDTARIAGGPSDRAPVNHTASPRGDQASPRAIDASSAFFFRERSTTTTSPIAPAPGAFDSKNATRSPSGETRIDQMDLASYSLVPTGNSISILFSLLHHSEGTVRPPVGLGDTCQDLTRQPAGERRTRESADTSDKRLRSPKDGHFPCRRTPKESCCWLFPASVIPCSRSASGTIRTAVPSQAALKTTVWPSGAKRAEEMIPRPKVSRW